LTQNCATLALPVVSDIFLILKTGLLHIDSRPGALRKSQVPEDYSLECGVASHDWR
jgi:hypothetical protein